MKIMFKETPELNFISTLLKLGAVMTILSIIVLLVTSLLNIEIAGVEVLVVNTIILIISSIIIFLHIVLGNKQIEIDADTGDIKCKSLWKEVHFNIRDAESISKEPIWYHCATFGYQYKYIIQKEKFKCSLQDILGNYESYAKISEILPKWIETYKLEYKEVK